LRPAAKPDSYLVAYDEVALSSPIHQHASGQLGLFANEAQWSSRMCGCAPPAEPADAVAAAV